jgi:hypothetical protein
MHYANISFALHSLDPVSEEPEVEAPANLTE